MRKYSRELECFSLDPDLLAMLASLYRLTFLYLCFSTGVWANFVQPKVDDLIVVEPVFASPVVVPGGEVWVGFNISLETDWHVYWKNSGESGYPTTIQWSLPEGWMIGELEFPSPYLYEYEGMTGYALENNFTVLARLKVPVSSSDSIGKKVELSGTFNALVCNEASCLPYEYSFSMDLTLGNDPVFDAKTREWLDKARAKLPIPMPTSSIGSASFSGSSGKLSIHGPKIQNLNSNDFIFFPEEPSISVGLSSLSSSSKNRSIGLDWRVAEGYEKPPQNLTGLLFHPSLSNAWEISFPIEGIGFSSPSHNYSEGTEYIADEFVLLRLLLAVVFIGMAAWAYGRSRQPSALVGNWYAFAILSLVYGLWLGYPGRVPSSTLGTLHWETWSQELQDKLLAEGEAVYVDYTAKWCLSCQVNKRVYGDQEVIDSIAAGNVKLLRADWTKKSAQILKSLQSYGREGVPLNVFYPSSYNGVSSNPLILSEVLSADLLSETMREGKAVDKKNKEYNFAALLGLAWLGGLILNLMPCVFPVIGLKIMGFVKQAGEERSSIIRHGWVFTLGVLLSFWLLVGVLLIMRDGLEEQLGWGFQLQEPGFVFILALILLTFGLSLSGVFEIGMSVTGIGSGLSQRSGLSGSFFSGVLATVVATPCMAPFLGVAVGAALTMPAFYSFIIFTAVGLGLSTPYLGLSFFPKWVQKLPKPGAWMESFKQFMAFPIYATVAWLIWTLEGLL